MIVLANRTRIEPALWSLILLGGLAGALLLNGYYSFVVGQIALLAIAGIGLNVLVGLSGQFSFGHAAFYAIGAYVVAICTSRGWLGFWLAWPLGVALATGIGALLALPALRVKGPYLAMVTIAFGLIVEQTLVEAEALTGGQSGILAIAPISIVGIELGDRAMAVLAVLIAALLLVGYSRLARNGWGAAMRAVRDSETAAASIGINPMRTRMAAFMLSAGCAATAGGLSAPLNSFVTPQSFDLSFSILLVLVVVIGGSASRAGPVLGAVVVGLLPEVLSSFEAYRVLAYGALVLLVLWVAPTGIAGLLRIRTQPAPEPSPPAALAGRLAARPRRDLDAQGLGISFGGVRAIDSLDLAIPAGTVTALIGPNGAGKSTVVNMLSGFYAPGAGHCSLGDAVLAPGKPWLAAQAGIARTYQTSALFDGMTVEENVLLALRCGKLGTLLDAPLLQSLPDREKVRELLSACGFAGNPATPAGELAHVDRRLVEIARALALDPDVVLLDEPAAGLSQAEKRALGDLLRAIAAAGIGVVLVEHDMGLVMGISDRIAVLRTGMLIASGSPAEIQADPIVREAYLGHGTVAPRLSAPPSGGDLCLGVYALEAGYGPVAVVHGVDLEVRQGEAVALLGANGAGKSTIMRIVAGLHAPASGHLRMDGTQINDLSCAERVRQGLVLVPEGRQVFSELSVRDNLRLGAFTTPKGWPDRMEQVLARFPRLATMLDRRAGLLSGGEQQMLAIGRALMAQPRMLLLDEPSLGLAPQATMDLFEQLEALRDEGVAMLIVDQMADLALALSSRAYVLTLGRVTLQGKSAEIAQSEALSASYLSG